MFIKHLRCFLTSLLLTCFRRVAPGLMRTRSSKPRRSINPKASLTAIMEPDLADGIETRSRQTQYAAVDLRRRPVL